MLFSTEKKACFCGGVCMDHIISTFSLEVRLIHIDKMLNNLTNLPPTELLFELACIKISSELSLVFKLTHFK